MGVRDTDIRAGNTPIQVRKQRKPRTLKGGRGVCTDREQLFRSEESSPQGGRWRECGWERGHKVTDGCLRTTEPRLSSAKLVRFGYEKSRTLARLGLCGSPGSGFLFAERFLSECKLCTCRRRRASSAVQACWAASAFFMSQLRATARALGSSLETDCSKKKNH